MAELEEEELEGAEEEDLSAAAPSASGHRLPDQQILPGPLGLVLLPACGSMLWRLQQWHPTPPHTQAFSQPGCPPSHSKPHASFTGTQMAAGWRRALTCPKTKAAYQAPGGDGGRVGVQSQSMPWKLSQALPNLTPIVSPPREPDVCTNWTVDPGQGRSWFVGQQTCQALGWGRVKLPDEE